MVNGGGESSDSLETDSVVSREVENRARSEERNQNRNRPSPRSKSVDPYLGRRKPWSAHVTTKAAGLASNRVVEHRLHYTRGNWDTSANPGHQANKTGASAARIHGPHPLRKLGAVHFEGSAARDLADQLMTQSYPPIVHVPLPAPPPATIPERTPSGIPKVSEYKSQFAWPPASEMDTGVQETPPRKSISMGALQAAQHQPSTEQQVKMERESQERKVLKSPPPVQEPVVIAKKVTEREMARNYDSEEQKLSEEEMAAQQNPSDKTKKFKTEYKAQFRAPSKYAYVDGTWKKMSRSADSAELQKEVNQSSPWYGEVIELRKKAGEYKWRSIGGNLTPEKLDESYSRQEMIEELASRSSLKALALATTPSTSKKPKGVDGGELIVAKAQQPVIRHHLERTTPPAGEMGYLITSPTRDHKLEPVQVQKMSKESKVSPGKIKAGSRPAGPRLVNEGQATAKPSNATTAQSRSSSAGGVHRSPKRTPRPQSMIVPGSKAQVNGVLNETTNIETPVPRKAEVKRPRPTSLATSIQAPARPKTAPTMRSGQKGPSIDDSLPRTHEQSRPKTAHVAPPSVPKGPLSSVGRPIRGPPTAAIKELPQKSITAMVNGEDEKMDADSLDGEVTKVPQLARSESKEIEETIMMKSPPEPTRVKSPEQILVRSPEPVKWTIPLETGIKWTGTPKSEGDPIKIAKEEAQSPPIVASPVEPPPSQSIENGSSSLSSELLED